MNNVAMIGNLGKDPEIRYTGSGIAVANFSIAVQRPFKNKQTNEYETDWFNCTAFRKTAELIADSFSKGSKIAFIGRVQNNNYTKDDGTKVYRDVILVENLTFIEPKSANNQNSQQNNGYKNNNQNNDDPFDSNNDSIDISDDFLPF